MALTSFPKQIVVLREDDSPEQGGSRQQVNVAQLSGHVLLGGHDVNAPQPQPLGYGASDMNVQGPGNWNGLKVPFLYATNGEIIWHLDVRSDKPASRTISNFHSATALEGFFSTDLRQAHDWLQNNSADQKDASTRSACTKL